MNGIDAPQRPDCVAGHVRLELRNVVAKYPFERSHRFPVIQPNSPPQRLFAFELPTASESFGASQTILIVAINTLAR
jgi:hypothetical protein